MNELVQQIIDYAQLQYAVEPDHPFSTAPTYAVLRHCGSRKWFALVMDVPRSRLGLPGKEKVDVLNVKCDPILSGSLRMEPGYLPAYHMNHEGWLTILLDGTVPIEDIKPLLDLSFELTIKKPKKRMKEAE